MTDDDLHIKILSIFIQLEKEARLADTIEKFRFTVCNNTKRLLPFDQAIFWEESQGHVRVTAVSAYTQVNSDSPFIVFLTHVIDSVLQTEQKRKLHSVVCEHHSSFITDHWNEWFSSEPVWAPFLNAEKDVVSGVIFVRKEGWKSSELLILEQLMESYQHSWFSLNKNTRRLPAFFYLLAQRRRLAIGTAALCTLLGFLPVHLSVLSPAEIAPVDPYVVSPSIKGYIHNVYVEPNQSVFKDQLLFTLDTITLTNKVDEAEKALLVANEKYRRMYEQSFNDASSKSQLLLFAIDVKKASAELDYAKNLYARSNIRASKPGVVIFSSKNDWIGKPVDAGQSVMLIADPNVKELDIHMSVSDAITLDTSRTVTVYLNVDPLRPLKAMIRNISYSASELNTEQLSYVVKANFLSGQEVPRIGLRGTAKLEGDQVTLFYYLFWRPVGWLRQMLRI